MASVAPSGERAGPARAQGSPCDAWETEWNCACAPVPVYPNESGQRKAETEPQKATQLLGDGHRQTEGAAQFHLCSRTTRRWRARRALRGRKGLCQASLLAPRGPEP